MIKNDPIVQIHKIKKPGSKKRMLNALVVVIFFIIIIIAAFLYLYPKNSKYILEDYTSDTVSIEDLENRIALTGLLDLKKQESLTATYSSVCTSIFKESGDFVKQGDVILVLESQTLLQDRDKAITELKKVEREVIKSANSYKRSKRALELSVKKSERAIERGEKKLDRIKTLFDMGSGTLQELEVVQDEYLELQETHKDLQTELDNLAEDLIADKILIDYDLNLLKDQVNNIEDQINNLTVKAPFNGTILFVNPTLGELVSQNVVVVKIGDLNTPYIKLNLPEKNRSNVNIGQLLEIKIDNKVYKGELTQINAIATRTAKGTTTIQVEGSFNTIPENIIPGSDCGAEIIVSTTPNSLTLPRGSFISTGKDRYLFKISNNGKTAERIKIVYGSMNSSRVSITKGVEIGDEIITSGYSDYINRELISLQNNN